MMEYAQLGILFAVGAMAGFMNVMAGGGSSLTLPALMLLVGLEGATANGTNRIALIFQNLFAVLSFRKQQMHQYPRSLQLSVVTLPGAIIGASLATQISDAWFRKILSLVLIGIVISMFFSPTKTRSSSPTTSAEGRRTWLIYPALFGIGFYGGFLQVGVGFMFMAALYHILRLDLVQVNMHKVFIILIYTIPALLVFMWHGHVNWGFGLCLAAGNACGAWWGAHAAVKGGEKIIRYVLAAAILVMSVKLLGVF
jgi:uncharacterized protein